MKLKPVSASLILFLTSCGGSDGSSTETTSSTSVTHTTTVTTTTTQTTTTGQKTGTMLSSNFVVEANPYVDEPGFQYFTSFVNVWGICVFGEEGVSEDKVVYVANVIAELIDNNEDGYADDAAVLESLVQRHATMPIFKREGSDAEEDLFDHYNGNGIEAVLYDGEVDPSQPGHWGTDASVEEILHTINGVGHVQVYPSSLGLSPDSSSLSAAMDVARGGQWTSVPSEYPEKAWYHYDDFTCNYQCMAMEYIYWAQVSNMGILDDPQTCNGIANEWELCSKELLESTDILVTEILNDPALNLPSNAPDGDYSP